MQTLPIYRPNSLHRFCQHPSGMSVLVGFGERPQMGSVNDIHVN